MITIVSDEIVDGNLWYFYNGDEILFSPSIFSKDAWFKYYRRKTTMFAGKGNQLFVIPWKNKQKYSWGYTIMIKCSIKKENLTYYLSYKQESLLFHQQNLFGNNYGNLIHMASVTSDSLLFIALISDAWEDSYVSVIYFVTRINSGFMV